MKFFLQEKRIYQEGVEEGLWVRWYEHGEKELEGQKINGQREGLWKQWSGNGHKWHFLTYKKDRLHGPATSWHEDTDQKYSEGHYKNEKQEGAWTYWDEKGQVSKKVFFKAGKAVSPPKPAP